VLYKIGFGEVAGCHSKKTNRERINNNNEGKKKKEKGGG